MESSAFANSLIANTIRNARSVPFYQQFWAGVDTETIESTRDLQRLPLLSKADAVRFTEEFQYIEAPSLLSHTSGTSGKITVRCRSLEELNCLSKVREFQPLKTSSGLSPLILSVDCQNHGQMIPSDVGQFGLKAVGFDFDVIDQVVQQITRHYKFPGYTEQVAILHGSVGFMKLLTMELLRRNIAPLSTGVKMIISYGEYLTKNWARSLTDLWSAPQINLYGASEVVGGARRCPTCGWLSFSPESFTEVVSIEDGTPVETGIGLLLMTELYPFSQLQPFIRFSPGDVVEVRNHNCSGTPAKNYRFLGRLDRCIRSSSAKGHILLFASDVYDIVDALPWIYRKPTFHRMHMDQWNGDLGDPMGSVSILDGPTESRKTIRFELVSKFSPTVFPEFASECATTVQRLLEGCLTTNALGSYSVEVRLTSQLEGATSFLAS